MPGSRQPDRFCSFPDCNRPFRRNRLCDTHSCALRAGRKLRPLGPRRPREYGPADFWLRVNKTKRCWEWTGRHSNEFGHGGFKGHGMTPHRYSWTIHKGNIPAGIFVLHKCDNPACVRPSHLFLGTQTVNVADRHKKGRSAYGESHGRALLTNKSVIRLRKMYASGVRISAMARMVKLNWTAVKNAVTGKTWRHVQG